MLSCCFPHRFRVCLSWPLTGARKLLVLALVALALTGSGLAQTLRIAAAADLEPVLPGVIDAFAQQTQAKVVASYASSATLAAQILQGGPFGLFLSADLSFPEKVVAAGLAQSAQVVPYARGTLVLWARNDSPLQPLSLASLRSPALHRLAVANPEHAPYGRAAKAALAQLGLSDSLQSKLVMAENIAQTAQFSDSGNADAGLLSLTSALTPRLRIDGTFVIIPQDAYPPLLQGAVVLKQEHEQQNLKQNLSEAQHFLDFLRTPSIQKQLAERGLKAP